LSATVLNFTLTDICSNTKTVTDRIVTVWCCHPQLPEVYRFLQDYFLQWNILKWQKHNKIS